LGHMAEELLAEGSAVGPGATVTPISPGSHD